MSGCDQSMQGLFVVGMHASGTSALASALVGLGLQGPRDELQADADHPFGFFESVSVIDLNEALLGHYGVSWQLGSSAAELLGDRWTADPWIAQQHDGARQVMSDAYPSGPWVMKDPRLCVLLPFWRQVVDDRAAAVVVTRNPIEIAQSLAMREAGVPLAEGLNVWDAYMRATVRNLAGMPVWVMAYEDLMHEPRRSCAELASWLGDLELISRREARRLVRDAAARVDARLRHQVADASDVAAMSFSQAQLYESLRAVAGGHASWQLLAEEAVSA